jgi:hypothetical protein
MRSGARAPQGSGVDSEEDGAGLQTDQDAALLLAAMATRIRVSGCSFWSEPTASTSSWARSGWSVAVHHVEVAPQPSARGEPFRRDVPEPSFPDAADDDRRHQSLIPGHPPTPSAPPPNRIPQGTLAYAPSDSLRTASEMLRAGTSGPVAELFSSQVAAIEGRLR